MESHNEITIPDNKTLSNDENWTDINLNEDSEPKDDSRNMQNISHSHPGLVDIEGNIQGKKHMIMIHW